MAKGCGRLGFYSPGVTLKIKRSEIERDSSIFKDGRRWRSFHREEEDGIVTDKRYPPVNKTGSRDLLVRERSGEGEHPRGL